MEKLVQAIPKELATTPKIGKKNAQTMGGYVPYFQ
jgi:hypothetical protein